MKHKKIAILLHKNDRRKNYKHYMVAQYAEFWRRAGLQVEYVFGVKKFVPADIAILHIDLSVVPQEYLEFGKKYPRTLNGNIRDIRKSAFSPLVLNADAPYDGPVIVKTDLNCFGWPERKNRSFIKKVENRALALFPGRKKAIIEDYPVYDHLADVPSEALNDPSLVIEKFLPEKEGDLFYTRTCHFCGDRVASYLLRSRLHIVKGPTCLDFRPIDSHAEVMEMRKRLHFDIGKFDYVVHDGTAFVFDINKTPSGGAFFANSPEIQEMRKYRAEGLFYYLNQPSSLGDLDHG